MAEFAYDNANNGTTDNISCKLNFGYHLCVLFENDTNPHLRSYSNKKLDKKLKDLISICQ